MRHVDPEHPREHFQIDPALRGRVVTCLIHFGRAGAASWQVDELGDPADTLWPAHERLTAPTSETRPVNLAMNYLIRYR